MSSKIGLVVYFKLHFHLCEHLLAETVSSRKGGPELLYLSGKMYITEVLRICAHLHV